MMAQNPTPRITRSLPVQQPLTPPIHLRIELLEFESDPAMKSSSRRAFVKTRVSSVLNHFSATASQELDIELLMTSII
jgi:hypothetical protein